MKYLNYALAGLLFFAGQQSVAFAGSASSHAPVPANRLFRPAPLPPATASTLQLLQDTRVNQDLAGTFSAEPAGYVNLDASTPFNCNLGVGNCIYEFQAMVQVQNDGVSTGDQIAICFLVDGNYVDNCHYVAVLPTDGLFSSYTYQTHAIGVKRGSHKVQAQVFTSAGFSAIGMYDVTYRMYTRY